MSKKYCVYASSGRSSDGRQYAFGDGVTASVRRVYAICETEEMAEAELSRLLGTRLMNRPRMPGDNNIYPDLVVGPFDPLAFVGSQNRDEYRRKRLAGLVVDLYQRAAANAAGLDE